MSHDEHTCEPLAAALSALIDSELEADRQLSVIDHLLACPSCQRFYQHARDLDGALAEIEAGDLAEAGLGPPPEAVWQRIAAASHDFPGVQPEQPPPPARTAHPWLTWAPRLAAVLLLAFGLWTLNGLGDGRRFETPGDTFELTLEGDRGQMSEGRFVALTTELLRADRRYHQKMLEVMTTVTRTTAEYEETPADRDAPAESRRLRASSGEDERAGDAWSS